MSAKCDVIVIGGGLGGLAAGATLARAGRGVRLYERHTQPGGYATTFFRDRFEFDVGLHELSGIGTPEAPGPLYTQLAELGVADQLRFVQVPALYRSLGAGLDVRVPPGREAALDALCGAFPHQRRGLRRLFDQLFTIVEEVDAMVAGPTAPAPARVLERYPNAAHAVGVPLSALLDRELDDPRARIAFAQLWGYFGLPPSRLSLLLFAIAVVMYLRWGGCTIQEKSQGLSNALADAIRDAGGEVFLAHGVSRIEVLEGRVRGVVTDEGRRDQAPIVVSNADPYTTCHQLIDPALIPESFRRRLAIAEPSLGSLCVFLGLSRPSRELGITDHEIFFNDALDPEEQYRACLTLEPPKTSVMCAYDVDSPEYCPPGTGVVVLVSLSAGRPWLELAPERYPATKQRLAQHLVQRAAQEFPDLPGSIETAVASTPITNMRYTGNPRGAIYGFANTPSENPGLRIDNRGPLEGLWFSGAWTQPGGSFQSCISCGVGVARAILAA